MSPDGDGVSGVVVVGARPCSGSEPFISSEQDAYGIELTGVMKENLLQTSSRGTAAAHPVILGGAALTAYVEQDLDEVFDGEVEYARDAFEGLRLRDSLMAAERGEVTKVRRR